MKLRLEKHTGSFATEAKRFYVPASIYWECSQCGQENEVNLADTPLSYPMTGLPFSHSVACPGNADHYCDHNETIALMLDINLSLVP